MDRINHVKIVTPDPAAIERFLREVLEVPEGWQLGDGGGEPPSEPVVGPARAADGSLTSESIRAFSRVQGSEPGVAGVRGFIAGDPMSRQFQILKGEQPKVWAVAIGSRNVERAHERCVERGIPCTEPQVTKWGADGRVTFIFAEVGGIVFEVMRAERA